MKINYFIGVATINVSLAHNIISSANGTTFNHIITLYIIPQETYIRVDKPMIPR